MRCSVCCRRCTHRAHRVRPHVDAPSPSSRAGLRGRRASREVARLLYVRQHVRREMLRERLRREAARRGLRVQHERAERHVVVAARAARRLATRRGRVGADGGGRGAGGAAAARLKYQGQSLVAYVLWYISAVACAARSCFVGRASGLGGGRPGTARAAHLVQPGRVARGLVQPERAPGLIVHRAGGAVEHRDAPHLVGACVPARGAPPASRERQAAPCSPPAMQQAYTTLPSRRAHAVATNQGLAPRSAHLLPPLASANAYARLAASSSCAE